MKSKIRRVTHEFWKFLAVGLIQFLISYSLFAILFWANPKSNSGLALCASYLISAAVGYKLNARFVFHQKPSPAKFSFYLLGYIPSLIFNWGVLNLISLENILVAQGAILAILAVANFLIQKVLTFRR